MTETRFTATPVPKVSGGSGSGAMVDSITVDAQGRITDVVWAAGGTDYVAGDRIFLPQRDLVTTTYTLLAADVVAGALQPLAGKALQGVLIVVPRPSPVAYVRDRSREAMAAYHAAPARKRTIEPKATAVFHIAQVADKAEYPSIVYYASGNQGESAFEGAIDSALAVRVEIRFRPERGSRQTKAEVLDEIEDLDRRILKQISGRVRSRLSVVDDFDEPLEFYRRIRTFLVRR